MSVATSQFYPWGYPINILCIIFQYQFLICQKCFLFAHKHYESNNENSHHTSKANLFSDIKICYLWKKQHKNKEKFSFAKTYRHALITSFNFQLFTTKWIFWESINDLVSYGYLSFYLLQQATKGSKMRHFLIILIFSLAMQLVLTQIKETSNQNVNDEPPSSKML